MLILTLLVSSISFCHSQEIEGDVIDFDTGTPLSYVNIGIPGKNIGTVSDIEGKFKLAVSKENLEKDSLVCSMLGYDKEKKAIGEIHDIIHFKLKQHTYQLNEVVVTSEKNKIETLGNQTKSNRKKVGIGQDKLGAELGTLIHIQSSPAFLKSANFYIVENNYGNIRLRLNIYSFKNDKPNESILNSPIYVETQIRKGVWTIDLAKYNIILQDDFVISLEYIQDMGFKGLYFSFDFNNSPSYFKATSQGEWKAFEFHNRPIGASFYVEISY